MKNKKEEIYAGFWVRILASVIDGLVLSIPINIIESLFGKNSWITILLVLGLWWFYIAKLLSSSWRATVGKKVLGLEVLDMEYEQLTFKEASVRSLYSFISYLFVLPVFMMFFNDKKQTFHDYFAKTVVIDKVARAMQNGQNIGISTATKEEKIGLTRLIRGVGIFIIIVVFAYSLYYFAMFAFVYGSLYSHNAKKYDNSFHIKYEAKDFNDSRIVFYKKELEKHSKKFIEANGMYEIFEADVKKDLALGCIQYFIRRNNKESWIEEGSNFRKNARNKYATTEEKIKKAKRNSNYMGKHFYTFDSNMVNHIEEDITELWSDKNDSICEQIVSVDDMYKMFVQKYIWQFPSSVCCEGRGKEWFKLFEKSQPKLSKEAKLDKLKQEEEVRIYVEQMEEKERKKTLIEKQNRLWQSAKKGNIYGLGYFKNINANIRNEKGQTPLMLAVQNGHDMVVSMMREAIVDVWAKDNKGKTAFDYISKPTNRREKMFGALRILEIEQIIGDKVTIPHIGYRKKTVKIIIHGANCSDFIFPPKTQCESM